MGRSYTLVAASRVALMLLCCIRRSKSRRNISVVNANAIVESCLLFTSQRSRWRENNGCRKSYLLIAHFAASLTSAFRSAPTYPGVSLATIFILTLSSSGSLKGEAIKRGNRQYHFIVTLLINCSHADFVRSPGWGYFTLRTFWPHWSTRIQWLRTLKAPYRAIYFILSVFNPKKTDLLHYHSRLILLNYRLISKIAHFLRNNYF